ncbi:hypothetical protein CsatA_017360 [Cannabis sativa]
MQTLGYWPLKGDLWIVSELGFERRSSNNGRRRRKSIWGLGFSSLLANNSRDNGYGGCYGKSRFDLGCGFSKLKVGRFCKPKKNSLGSSVALVFALEQQAIGSEFQIEEEFNSNGTLSENSEIDGNLHLSSANNGGGKEQPKRETGVGSEGENGGKVNVRELGLSLGLAKTADDVDEILKDKGELPLQVYSTLIRGLGREKLLDSAFAVHEWLKRKKEETNGVIGPNLFIYNSLLGAVKQSEKYGEMEKILNDMSQEGVVPNIVTYNTIMAIYLEKGQGVKALNILQEIQKKGLTPSPVSYSTALLAYRRMEDGNSALKFFVEIREKYQKGEIGKDGNGDEDWENELFKLENFTIRICYQVMRRWLVSRSNLSTEVLKLLMAMDNAGIPLGRSEYERLLWACTREDHYLVAKELYDRIREKYFDISLSVCNHLIWLMGKAKKWWTALEIYEDLLDKGPKPNNMSHELIVSHFNILLTAARKRGIWRWGIRLLNKMEEKGLKPGTKEWNAVLVACSKASETTAAVKIFKRMVEQGQKPTSLSYGALLSALEKGKLYDEARQVWEHMLKVGVEPNLYVYTIMASVFAGHGKFNLVETVLSEMNSSGIEPTVVTYNAIISGCARNDMSSAAFEWFHRMKAHNIPPNNVSYEMLIEALARDSKPRLAYELYLKAAKTEDFDLSPKAYDIVVESSKLYGIPIDLRVLGPRPPDRKDTVNK